MTGVADTLTDAELALDSYLEDLLWEPGDSNPGEGVESYSTFDVSGLRVAVPAVGLAGASLRTPLRQAPGDPAWLCRMASDRGDLPLVDIALLVLPQDLAPGGIPLEERCDRVLLMDDGAWGIALEGPVDETPIDGDAVCWRGPLGQRPWLAGTLAEQRCVLLDLANIRQLGQLGNE